MTPPQMLHEKIHDEVVERLKKAYGQVKIGDPLDGETREHLLYLNPEKISPPLLSSFSLPPPLPLLFLLLLNSTSLLLPPLFLPFPTPPPPHSEGVLYGPLHSEAAVKNFEKAITDVQAQGGTVAYGGKVIV